MELSLCQLETPRYFIFSSNVPELLYYSHIPAALMMLFLGGFLFLKQKNDVSVRLLASLFLLSSLWLALDVFIWASNQPSLNIFLWSNQILLEVVIYLIAFLLTYQFIFQKTIGAFFRILLYILVLPVVLFLATPLTLSGINLIDCDAMEGIIATVATYLIEIIFIAGIIGIAVYGMLRKDTENKHSVVYFSLGILAFLTAFTSGNLVGSITGDWVLAQYGLFGIPIFVAMLAYLIVKYKVFHIKVIGAQALMITLIALTLSQYFYLEGTRLLVLSTITLVLTLIAGYFLIRSVKREVERKEELEKLSRSLAIANDRLEELDKQKSEFISIASHQLRTPLTAIRGYISLALEGSYGPIKGTPMKDMLDKMYTIDLRLSQLVEDLLNVSKIEAGRVQYKWESVALEMITQELYDMFTVLAEKKGLKLHLIKPAEALPLMRLDMNKIKELLSNLIDNAIKYTEQGSVTIKVEQIDELARVTIQDTGIGISKEDADHLFGKFIRTETTKKMDSGGSGLGLFIGRTFVEGHGGRVYATSDGEGKGSSFIVELPLVNPKAE